VAAQGIQTQVLEAWRAVISLPFGAVHALLQLSRRTRLIVEFSGFLGARPFPTHSRGACHSLRCLPWCRANAFVLA
jgi:hypothetical protein